MKIRLGIAGWFLLLLWLPTATTANDFPALQKQIEEYVKTHEPGCELSGIEQVSESEVVYRWKYDSGKHGIRATILFALTVKEAQERVYFWLNRIPVGPNGKLDSLGDEAYVWNNGPSPFGAVRFRKANVAVKVDASRYEQAKKLARHIASLLAKQYPFRAAGQKESRLSAARLRSAYRLRRPRSNCTRPPLRSRLVSIAELGSTILVAGRRVIWIHSLGAPDRNSGHRFGMTEHQPENLSQFIRRVMAEKGLTLRDIETRSGGRITDGYVSSLLANNAKNPTVEKLKALADGLGVDLFEIFRIASGISSRTAVKPANDTVNTLRLLDMMKRMVIEQELLEIMQEVARLPRSERRLALRLLRTINEASARLDHKRQVC